MEYNQKITAAQLKRKAVIYVRQSSMKQVFENTESTIRQYALKEKLVSLGWQAKDIDTIDCDLGQSGSGSSERGGFKKLVADVSNDEVGAIACLEPSRLARNSQEWNRLMEICSITRTILVDSDGIYDLNDFNDRMLLGLKGTMNEAELYLIRARMRGGALSKAKRGELRTPLPVGYVYDEAGCVIKDPNIEVQSAINLFFEAFRICGSASKMASYYLKNGYKIPTSPARGFSGKELVWVNLSSARALDILHNPTYAGIYAYGQRQTVVSINGKKTQEKPIDEWHTRIADHHEGYISEAEFKWNQNKLLMNNTTKSAIPPVREGNALLQGICMCGLCGRGMGIRYHGPNRENTPYYVCETDYRHYGREKCQYVHGGEIDRSISELILERLTPIAISNAIKVEEEVNQREADSDNYFILKLQRAQYEANLAKKRYMNVDPSYRLVAFELEKLWNQKISELAKAEEELRVHENSKKKEPADLRVSELMAIPENIKEIWNNGNIVMKDKKRLVRCLIEDVTITKKNQTIRLGVRFKTGATTMIECQNPPMGYTKWTTSGDVVELIRRESASYTKEEITAILQKNGHLSGKGLQMTVDKVGYIMKKHNIPSLQEHLKAKGFLTVQEKAAQLNISTETLHNRKNSGRLVCEFVKTSGCGDFMFAP